MMLLLVIDSDDLKDPALLSPGPVLTPVSSYDVFYITVINSFIFTIRPLSLDRLDGTTVAMCGLQLTCDDHTASTRSYSCEF